MLTSAVLQCSRINQVKPHERSLVQHFKGFILDNAERHCRVQILRASTCRGGSSPSAWKTLCPLSRRDCVTHRSDIQVAEWMSENSEPLETQISAQTQCKASKWTRNKTTQTRGWNPVSTSLNKHWKWIWVKIRPRSRERRKTSGPDYTTRWQQDVSSPLFVSSSSALLYQPVQHALRFSQHRFVSVFSLSFSVLVFSGCCLQR